MQIKSYICINNNYNIWMSISLSYLAVEVGYYLKYTKCTIMVL